jgi:hypothetical protein
MGGIKGGVYWITEGAILKGSFDRLSRWLLHLAGNKKDYTR